MKNKILLLLLAMVLTLTMTGCGSSKETTMTGMVVSVDGTIVSLLQFGGEMSMGDMPQIPAGGEMPNMEGFEGFENFNPEDFDGEIPELPEGAEIPKMPEGGEIPDSQFRFNGGETTAIDLTNAHISVELDGVKASGSFDDIVPGSILTITMNSKGEATNVVVSSVSGFSGFPRYTKDS